MKSVTNQRILNNIPDLYISHEGLCAIKEIVKLAPVEAQWFNTVEVLEYQDSPGEIYLLLSDKLYIPTQNTSATQVDTSGQMLIEFYNELKNDYSQNEVNSILSSMTCWSHSHVNMNPHPSLQDENQFKTFVKQSLDQEMNKFQIMLIFNKKDEYYSRIYDPRNGNIYEGVPLQTIEHYDFDYIKTAAKTKFKKATPKYKNKNHFFGYQPDVSAAYWNQSKQTSSTFNYLDDILDQDSSSNKSVNHEIAMDVITTAFNWVDPYQPLGIQNKIIPFTKDGAKKFTKALAGAFDDKELLIFKYIYDGTLKNKQETNKILNIFTDKAFDKFIIKNHDPDLIELVIESIENTHLNLQEIYAAILKTLNITDLSTKAECKEFLNASR